MPEDKANNLWQLGCKKGMAVFCMVQPSREKQSTD
jgi:hypothetical protein